MFFSAVSFADSGEKNPWSVSIYGNKVFSKFQLNEQLDIPEEFAQLDTIKQDFLMRLSSENVRALYYSRGYYSLDLKMEIVREDLSNGTQQRNYHFTVNEGECYTFNDAQIISEGDAEIPIDLKSLKISKHQNYNQEDLSEDLQEIQKAYRKQGFLHVYISSEEHVDTTAKHVNVIINVRPGSKVLMGNIITTTQRAINKNERKDTNILTADDVAITGRAPFRDEFVTCGGVSLSGIYPTTMESRHRKNLFFAGEVLDIDGVTGGFNFQAAWTTAYVAAQAMATISAHPIHGQS